MVWAMETSVGFESDKIATLIVPYAQGEGLDIGCGQRKAWPDMIGIDSCKDYGGQKPASVDIKSEAHNLKRFTDESMDYVFSSHLLEHYPEEEVLGILKEWTRVLKPGGNLILYLPSANLYPKCKPELQPGANPDHKWDIYPGDMEKKLRLLMEHDHQDTIAKIPNFKAGMPNPPTLGWTQLECEERNETNEYSLFEVYKKRTDGQFIKQIWQRNPEGKQRCLVIRYGAIGDALMVSSILPGLKKQGYHLTFQCAPKTHEILRDDPNIDEWQVQAEDYVPNPQLGAYWETILQSKRYDKIINLCESVECSLLPPPGRLQHHYPVEARRKLLNVNYLERQHDIAGVPYDFAQKFYPSKAELEGARALLESKIFKRGKEAPTVIWALNGSALHKVYPWINIVCAWLVEKTPAHIFLMGDKKDGLTMQAGILKTMEEDGCDMSRIHPLAGELPIRQSLSLAMLGDVIVGPETGILNAAAFEDMAKVIYLSHSSHENLTKHWKNTTVLEASQAEAPCYPCHRLHYSWEYCQQEKSTGAALCASRISADRVFKAIVDGLLEKEKIKEAA